MPVIRVEELCLLFSLSESISLRYILSKHKCNQRLRLICKHAFKAQRSRVFFSTLCTFCNLMGEILINPFSTLNKPLRNPMETLTES